MFVRLGVLTSVLQGLTLLILMVSLGMPTFRFVATMVAEKPIEYPHSFGERISIILLLVFTCKDSKFIDFIELYFKRKRRQKI